MTTFYLAADMQFISVPHADDEQFEGFLDTVLEELDVIGCVDADYSASLRDRNATFTMSVQAEDFPTGAIRFLGDLRTALHASECATPEWPTFHSRNQHIRALREDSEGSLTSA